MTSSDKTEPPGSASSSQDERQFCGQCRHHHRFHADGVCDACSGFLDGHRHDFVLVEPECVHCAHYRAEDGKDQCCKCDALVGDAPAKPECEHPNKQHTGSVYDGPGGCKTWLYFRCPDCEALLKEEEVPAEPECSCASGNPADYDGPMRDCPTHGEPEAPGDEDTWPCGDCGAAVPKSQDWCTAPDCPKQCLSSEGCHRVVHCDPGCAVTSRMRDEAMAPREPEVPRRPPYAVTYAVEGGHAYEIALPGDASVHAVDGVLTISHPGAVLALVQVQPFPNKEQS